jgi:hypothetical protein
MGKVKNYEVCPKAKEKIDEIRKNALEEMQKQRDFMDCLMAGICPKCAKSLDIYEKPQLLTVASEEKSDATLEPITTAHCSCGFSFTPNENK